MSMGFTNTEARLALRSSFNNVDAAIEQIFKVLYNFFLKWLILIFNPLIRKNKEKKKLKN